MGVILAFTHYNNPNGYRLGAELIRLLKSRQYYVYAAIIILGLVLITIGNMQVLRGYPAGDEFIAHWVGTRAFISDGMSPYSDDVTADIVTTIKGLHPDNTATEYRFLAPLFALLLYAPVSLVKNAILATAIWMTILEVSLLLTGFSLLHRKTWKKPASISILLILFAMFSYPSVISILNGDMVIISFVLIIFSVMAIRNSSDETAGVMLGISLVKPDIALPIVILLIIWAIIVRRFKIFYWFTGTLIILMGFSLLLIPSWPLQYARSVFQFSFDNPISSNNSEITGAFTGISNRFTIVKIVFLLAILIVEWFFIRHRGTKRLYWLLGITMSASLWLSSRSPVEYLIFTIPGLFYGLELFMERWKGRISYLVSGLLIVLLVGQWIISGFFLPETLMLPSETVLRIVLPGISLLLLYWSRWWALYGKKLDDLDRF